MYPPTVPEFSKITRRLAYWGAWAGAAAFAGLIIAQSCYDYQGGFLIAPAILVLALFLLPRLSRVDASRLLLTVMIIGLLAKIAGALIRMYVSFGVYSRGFRGGLGADISGGYDSGVYNQVGRGIAENIRSFEFAQAVEGFELGTEFLRFFTGLVYSLIGPTLIGGFLFFGFLAFLGSYFAYKAFRTAFPDENHQLFAILIFFYPSILYWSNGIGKDAVMAFGIGLAAYGSALILTKARLTGFLPLAFGLGMAFLVRPHIAGMLALALGMGAVIMAARRATSNPLVAAIWIAVGAAVAWLFLVQTMSFLGLDDLSVDTTVGYISARQKSTFEGGAAFDAPSITEPLGIPMAIITLLFRPFPWESHNVQALIQALDGFLLLGLVGWRFRSIWRAVSLLRSNPFVLYILSFTLMAAIAFTVISNFGTLARERTMVLPLVLMLIAINPSDKKKSPLEKTTNEGSSGQRRISPVH
jgi:hypothetical protein